MIPQIQIPSHQPFVPPPLKLNSELSFTIKTPSKQTRNKFKSIKKTFKGLFKCLESRTDYQLNGFKQQFHDNLFSKSFQNKTRGKVGWEKGEVGGAIKTRARTNNIGLTLIDFNLHSNGLKINDVTRIFMIGFLQAAPNHIQLFCLFLAV
jgi:hypothetical protein